MSDQNILSDPIESLPVDSNPPSHDEIQLIDTIFEKHQTTFERILKSAKDVLLIGSLFILFSIPQIDGYIRKFIRAAESPYLLIVIKAVMFMVIYYAIKNLYLVRTN